MLEKIKNLRHDLAHKLGHKIARAENASHTGYLLMVAIAPHEYVALVALSHGMANRQRDFILPGIGSNLFFTHVQTMMCW